jgi:hypothetical protein
MTDYQTVAGSIIAALLTIAAILPRLLNAIKGEGLTGSVLDRLKTMEEHAKVMDRRAIVQDDKIHRYAVKVTKLVVLMIRLEALLIANQVLIPQDIIDEMFSLKAETDVEDQA